MAKKKKAARKKPVKRAVRKPTKKPVKRKSKKPASRAKKEAKAVVLGSVTHYFPKVRAAVVKVKRPLAVGDDIRIKGHTTDFTQAVTSLQIDRVPIEKAKKGQEIGLLVDSRVRQHDIVYKA
jgi:putative protease